MIPGDGIGPEVISQAVNVVDASGADVELTHFDWSANRYLADGVTVPPDGFAMLERSGSFGASGPRRGFAAGVDALLKGLA